MFCVFRSGVIKRNQASVFLNNWFALVFTEGGCLA
jgi:hypothetical protein